MTNEQKIKESVNVHDKKLKLKALTFKQNREIQNMLEIFNDSDDSESDINDTKSESLIKIEFLDNNLRKYMNKIK